MDYSLYAVILRTPLYGAQTGSESAHTLVVGAVYLHFLTVQLIQTGVFFNHGIMASVFFADTVIFMYV
jgi:hypothetical protein